MDAHLETILTDFNHGRNRRQYPRVQAPIYCWSEQFTLGNAADGVPLVDISLGGMRLHLAQEMMVNSFLEMELVLPDKTHLHCRARVAWLSSMPSWAVATAKYDVGFQFVALSHEAVKHLARILGQEAWLD